MTITTVPRGTSAPIVAFARDVLRFTLWPRQAAILGELYAESIRTAVLRLGRRSGKGRMAAVVATYEATVNAALHLAVVEPGEQVAIVVVARSQKQARIVHRFIRSFIRRAVPGQEIVRDTVDEVELASGIVVMTLPCDAASVRGPAVAVVILDEAAWFAGRDGSPLDPKEVWAALVPATAQFPERRVLVLSTPRFASGWFYDLCERAAAGATSGLRHWHASTSEVNPTIPADFFAAERDADPVLFAREYDALFEASITAVLDPELVRAAVRREPDVLPPRPDVRYAIAIDPAMVGDTWSLLVGHRDAERRVIVDRVDGWAGSRGAPLQVDLTLDVIAAYAAAYNGAPVLTDQYAATPIAQGLRQRGVTVLERPWHNEGKVEALTSVRRVLYAAQLEIPNRRELIAELVSLEQRPTPAGRPRIAAAGGGHDDYATALLALVHHLARLDRATRILRRDPATGRVRLEYVDTDELRRTKAVQRERHVAYAGHFD